MGLDRDELAARVLCALVTKDGVNGYGSASDAVRAADDLLLALKPAEVAPVAAGNMGRVTEGTRLLDGSYFGPPNFPDPAGSPAPAECEDCGFPATPPACVHCHSVVPVPPPATMPAPDAPPYRGADCLNMIGAVVDYFGQSFIVTSHGKSQLLGFPDALASGHVTPSAITFLRWATDEERKQHRIPTPAPEAKRPTHVRVTREIPSWSGGDRIEAGTVFPVERWEGANGGYPFVKPTGRNGFILHPREWEPCAAPPAPESKRDEAVRCAERAVVEAAEAVYANGYGFAKDRLLDAVEALRRAREAGLCEGGSK